MKAKGFQIWCSFGKSDQIKTQVFKSSLKIFLRLKRICSREEDFINSLGAKVWYIQSIYRKFDTYKVKHSAQMTKHFSRRSYPLHILNKAYHKVKILDRDSVLDKTKKKHTHNQTPRFFMQLPTTTHLVIRSRGSSPEAGNYYPDPAVPNCYMTGR